MTERERVESALAAVPSDVDRDTWVRIGMAVKSEYGDDGFDLWDGWSQGAANYDANDARDVWKSIKSGGGVTVGTLFRIAKEYGWQPSGDYKPPSAEEQEQRRRQREAEQAKAEAEAKHLAAKARKRAGHIWSQAQPAPADHGYLQAKCVSAHGLRLFEGDLTLAGCDCRGALIVPIRDTAGKLHSLEFITADGQKRFLPDGGRPGHFHLLGNVDDGAGWLAVAEGYATAASVHEASGWPVACAFAANNLLPVAQALRARFPDAKLVLCGDDDRETRGNPGVTRAQAAAAAVGGWLYVPDFAGIEPRGTDANDLARAAGLDALAAQLRAAAEVGPAGAFGLPSQGENAGPAAGESDPAPAAQHNNAEANTRKSGDFAQASTTPAETGAKVLPFPGTSGGKKPRAVGAGQGGTGGGDGPFANREVGQYRLADGVIFQVKNTREGSRYTFPWPISPA